MSNTSFKYFKKLIANQRYKDLIIQISSPYNTGLGFYVDAYQLIVTNAHIVEGNKDVVINGSGFENTIVEVLYIDQVYDLAFLELPITHHFPTLSFNYQPKVNTPISTIDFDEKYSLLKGKIVQSKEVIENTYFATDLDAEQSISGTPILNDAEQILGMTTFFQVEKGKYTLALTASKIKETLEKYRSFYPAKGTRCEGCETIIPIQTLLEDNKCSDCGKTIDLPQPSNDYEPTGVGMTIESLINALGHNVRLSRRGPFHWAVQEGSATIHIAYYERLGYITADAFLCELPTMKKNIKPIYEFLLKQNSIIKGLTFSIREQDIVLSLIIYDRNFNIETALFLFQNLLERADYYDNVLVEEFGGVWK